MKQIVISHLYPNELNIYGDRGNIIALKKRMEWRGHSVQIEEVHPGHHYDFTKSDIIFGGGGQDKGQELVAEDLQKRKDEILAAARDGVVILGICGTYQLLGQRFTTLEGKEIRGIGVLKAETIGSRKRMIGNVVISTSFGTLVGFENHSGKTNLFKGQEPLGKVLKGYGNNGSTGLEGAVLNNVFGTYLHGPLLPKNPRFTDELLRRALLRKYGKDSLEPLNDSLEHQASRTARSRPQ